MVEATKVPPVKGPEKKERKGFGAYVAGTAITIVAVGGLFAREACQTEGVRKECTDASAAVEPAETKAPPLPQKCEKCEPCTPCEAPASKTDEVCEPAKGETDLRSPNYDQKNCNRCGDGVAQEWEYASWAPPEDLGGKVECDVDFHCGNERLERNAEYGTLEPVLGGADGKEIIGYAVRHIEITESCRTNDPNYCEADCPKQAGTGRPRPDAGQVAVVQPTQTTTPLERCEGDDASSVMGASGWGTLVTRVQRAVNPAKGNIRSALGVASSPVTATVTVTLRISTSGIPSVQGISARCGGPNEECPGSISLGILTSTGSINLEGVRTGSPSVECLMGVPTPLRP